MVPLRQSRRKTRALSAAPGSSEYSVIAADSQGGVVRESMTRNFARIIVCALVCLSTACMTMRPVAMDASGEQLRREVTVGDTVRVLTKAGASHSFQITAISESSLAGNAVKVSGGGPDAVGTHIDVRYLDIAHIEVQRVSGLITTSLVAAVVLGALLIATGGGNHSPGYNR